MQLLNLFDHLFAQQMDHPLRILVQLLLLSPTALVLFVGSNLPTTLSSEKTYPYCHRSFSCGVLTNITYPFSGGQRPDYCGLPSFQLTCLNNTITEISIETVTESYDGIFGVNTVSENSYRVLDIDQKNNWLRLAIPDLHEGICPQHFFNSTFRSPFAVGDLGELTLFYGCSSKEVPSMSQNQTFSCKSNEHSSKAYFITGALPSDPLVSFPICNLSVQVPIAKSTESRLKENRSSLLEVLRDGFSVRYNDELYSFDCIKCMHSGGQCGYNSELNSATCICGDRICHQPGPLSRSLWKVMIGIGGFFTISAILVCYFGRRIILNQIVGFSKSKEKENYQKFEAFLRNYGSLAPKRYTYSEVKKITNCFKDKLGQGGYGSVYKGKLDDGHLVAVKILGEIKDNGEDFINEVASISRTSHVNIVTLMGFCFEKSKRALVYEFVSNGSLDKHIYHDGREVNSSLGWKNFERITIGVAQGLEYLHQGCNTRILHFDIKPQNILLDEDFCPKIADFGLSKLCQRKVSHISMLGTRGTAGYIAPEVFSRNFGPISHKSDVYSFGMMVLDMLGGRQHLKNGISSQSDEMFFPDWIYKLIEPGHGSRIFGGMTTEEEETVRKMILVSLWCIQTKPSDRPSMKKVLEMFEASVYSLQIPPRPILSTPEAYEDQINTSIMSSEISSHEP